MIPSPITRSLLHVLRKDLSLFAQTYVCGSQTDHLLEKHFGQFCTLLLHAEDDLSLILSLMEQDNDCSDHNPKQRIKALIDYVDIACALYENPAIAPSSAFLH